MDSSAVPAFGPVLPCPGEDQRDNKPPKKRRQKRCLTCREMFMPGRYKGVEYICKDCADRACGKYDVPV